MASTSSAAGAGSEGLDVVLHAVYKKQGGELRLGRDALGWTADEGPGDAGATSVVVAYADVGSVLGAKGKPFVNVVPLGREPKEGYVFQLDSIDKRDYAKDVLVGLKRAAAATAGGTGAGGGAVAVVRAEGAGPGHGEVSRRARCLATHPEVRRLYDRLVGEGGALTEDEFWADRADILDGGADEAARRQATGPTSVFSDDLAGFMKRTGSGDTVNIKLTASLIHEIFVTYPAVQRAFRETVGSGPGKISEKEFWTRYYRYQYFNAGSSAQAVQEATGEAVGGDALFASVMSKENEQATLAKLEAERKAKVQALGDATINLAKDPGEALYAAGGAKGGYGIAHGGARDGSEVVVQQVEAARRDGRGGGAQASRNRDSVEGARLVHRYNRHAEILLDQIDIGGGGGWATSLTGAPAQSPHVKVERASTGALREALEAGDGEEAPRPKRSRGAAGMEDLEDIEEAHYVPLVIEDQVRYFDRSCASGPSPAATVTQHSSWEALRDALQGTRSEPLLAPSSALYVLTAMRAIVKRERAMRGPEAQAGAEGGAPAEARQALHADFMASCELLRHFWRTLPSCGATSADRARMKRLVASLSSIRARTEAQRALGDAELDKDPHAKAAWDAEAQAVLAPMLHADRVFADVADEWAKLPEPVA